MKNNNSVSKSLPEGSKRIPAVVWPPDAALLVPPGGKCGFIAENHFPPVVDTPGFVCSSECQALHPLPLGDDRFLGCNASAQTSLIQAPPNCGFTDVQRHVVANLPSCLKGIIRDGGNDKQVLFFGSAARSSGPWGVADSAVLFPVRLYYTVDRCHRSSSPSAYLSLRDTLSTVFYNFQPGAVRYSRRHRLRTAGS